MNLLTRRQVLGALVGTMLCGLSCAPIVTGATGVALPPPTTHDGIHDFDFEFGTWRCTLMRRRPLSTTTHWTSYRGTSVVRRVWGGKSNLGELDLSGGSGSIKALSLRLYDPATRQWNIYFASDASGSISIPTIGHFDHGNGEFYDRETFDGKPVRVRFRFSEIAARSFRFDQAYSSDDGETWLTNWSARFAR